MNTKRFFQFIFLFFIFTLFVFLTKSFAVSPTPKTSPTDSPTPTQAASLDKQISDLKERIASKVAQLRLVERRGILGKVTDVSNSQITISDAQDNPRFIDVDELTKFASPSAKDSFGISDITKGSTLGILGLYNKQSQRLLARFVNVLNLPTFFHGAVASVDKTNYTFVLTTDDNTNITISIENITKTVFYTKDSDVTRSGFSKILPDEHVIVVGFPDAQDKTQLTATRVILFPDIPKNPKIITTSDINPTAEPTKTASSSATKTTR